MSKQKIELTVAGVTHTFDCVANQNPMVRVFIDTSPGAVVLANRISEQYRASSANNDGTRFTMRMSLPVPASIAGSDAAGYTPAPKAVGTNTMILNMNVSKFATPAQVAEFTALVQAYVASSEFSQMVTTQLMC